MLMYVGSPPHGRIIGTDAVGGRIQLLLKARKGESRLRSGRGSGGGG